MVRFLAKLIAGHVRRHRLEAVLCLVGVALGVAVTVAVDAAVTACVQSFGGAVDSLAQRSTHSVFAASGTLTDEQYIALLRRDLPVPLSPVIDRRILANDAPARLIGIDVFAERRMRSFTQMQSSLSDDAFRRFMTEPGAVVLVKPLADRLGQVTGAVVQLTVGSRRADAHVVGIVTPTGVGGVGAGRFGHRRPGHGPGADRQRRPPRPDRHRAGHGGRGRRGHRRVAAGPGATVDRPAEGGAGPTDPVVPVEPERAVR